MTQLRARLAVFMRQKRGTVPQRVFARKTGLAQSTIMRIENQDQNVTLDTLEQLCRAFRVDVADLFPLQVRLPNQHESYEHRPYRGVPPSEPDRPAMVHEPGDAPDGPLGRRGKRQKS